MKAVDNSLPYAYEHASISIPAGSEIAPGDRIELWPSHIDPTINLHDALYAVESETVIDVWPVSARGYAEQRGPQDRGAASGAPTP